MQHLRHCHAGAWRVHSGDVRQRGRLARGPAGAEHQQRLRFAHRHVHQRAGLHRPRQGPGCLQAATECLWLGEECTALGS